MINYVYVFRMILAPSAPQRKHWFAVAEVQGPPCSAVSVVRVAAVATVAANALEPSLRSETGHAADAPDLRYG